MTDKAKYPPSFSSIVIKAACAFNIKFKYSGTPLNGHQGVMSDQSVRIKRALSLFF